MLALQKGRALPAPTFGNRCPDGCCRVAVAVECEADDQQPWLEAYKELIMNPITSEYEDFAEELELEKAWLPLEYKGYVAVAGYSKEDKCYVGKVINVDGDVVEISFDGETPGELQLHFEESVDCYLGACEGAGREPAPAKKVERYDGVLKSGERWRKFEISEWLDSKEVIEGFLKATVEFDDPVTLKAALLEARIAAKKIELSSEDFDRLLDDVEQGEMPGRIRELLAKEPRWADEI